MPQPGSRPAPTSDRVTWAPAAQPDRSPRRNFLRAPPAPARRFTGLAALPRPPHGLCFRAANRLRHLQTSLPRGRRQCLSLRSLADDMGLPDTPLGGAVTSWHRDCRRSGLTARSTQRARAGDFS
jgi:hypothetical protein